MSDKGWISCATNSILRKHLSACGVTKRDYLGFLRDKITIFDYVPDACAAEKFESINGEEQVWIGSVWNRVDECWKLIEQHSLEIMNCRCYLRRRMILWQSKPCFDDGQRRPGQNTKSETTHVAACLQIVTRSVESTPTRRATQEPVHFSNATKALASLRSSSHFGWLLCVTCQPI